jgi:serine/threonine protein kinase
MSQDERLTRAGFFVGTLMYVAPEALSGELVGPAADQYSLATIAYLFLTGNLPYTARGPREMFTQLLDVSNEMPGRIGRQVSRRRTCVWRTAAAIALIEHDDPVAGWVEHAAVIRRTSGAGPTVEEHDRLSCRVARHLEVQVVAVAHVEHPRLVRLDFRI